MTPSDAAHILGVSADTVRALSDNGRLPTMRTIGGRRLFRRGDVDKLAVDRARGAAQASKAAAAGRGRKRGAKSDVPGSSSRAHHGDTDPSDD